MRAQNCQREHSFTLFSVANPFLHTRGYSNSERERKPLSFYPKAHMDKKSLFPLLGVSHKAAKITERMKRMSPPGFNNYYSAHNKKQLQGFTSNNTNWNCQNCNFWNYAWNNFVTPHYERTIPQLVIEREKELRTFKVSAVSDNNADINYSSAHQWKRHSSHAILIRVILHVIAERRVPRTMNVFLTERSDFLSLFYLYEGMDDRLTVFC